jgi:hypothetical protein
MSPLVVELAPSNGSWGGLIGNVPSGTNRAFLAEAFDASGTLRFKGQVSGISIPPNQTTAVALTLQQTPPPPLYGNEAPFIDSLVASSNSVQTGGALSLNAMAHDPNPGDTLTWAWTATHGTFSDSTAATTSWTAPSSVGVQTLMLTVKDSQGIAASVSIAVNVVSGSPTNAQLDISFNLWPVVSGISASLSRLDAGQATAVSALAADADGDALSYQWTSTCAGTWKDATSNAASFVPSSVPDEACNNCLLTVTVQDGRGGQTKGSLNLCVATASPTERFAPLFTDFSQPPSSLSPDQTVAFDVTAMDPQGSSLTFAWTTHSGSLAAAQSTATSSRVEWTAPSCIVTGVPPTVTAVVTNAHGLSTSIPFSLSGLPTCTPGWATAGSFAGARATHSATLLSSGKVLIMGGHTDRYGNSPLASAAVYDPGSGTWSATAPMTWARGDNTATLLPAGKVLVSGGYNWGALDSVEVYDPASGTWSAGPSMTSPRHGHTATPLPDGKVLVSGGWHRSALNAVEVYDPASGTWSTAAPMISVRWGHTATRLLNGKVLVTGGCTNGYGTANLRAAEVYDPGSGTWSTSAPMASARWAHTATLLPNGKVLVTGGNNGSSDLASAEVYDPASGTWSTAAPMAAPHPAHRATLLLSGKVLVSGSGSDPTPPSAEVYDPAANTWSAAAPMTTPRAHHTATRLPNGQVLVTGGFNGSHLAGAELYTP